MRNFRHQLERRSDELVPDTDGLLELNWLDNVIKS
jgi:hypothetical protein